MAKALFVHAPDGEPSVVRMMSATADITDQKVFCRTFELRGNYMDSCRKILIEAQTGGDDFIFLENDLGNEIAGCLIAILLWKGAWIPILKRSAETDHYEMVIPAIQTTPLFVKEGDK